MSGPAKSIDFADTGAVRILDWRNVFRIDWIMLLIVCSLAGIGFLALYSASQSTAANYYLRQVVFFAIGLGLAGVIVTIDHRLLVSLAPFFYITALVLLAAVLFKGATVKGGQRWLVFYGPLRVQPSELTKIALVYMLTWYFGIVKERIRRLPFFLLTFAIPAVPGLLILKQPNLSTAASLGPITFVMLYVAGCKRWHVIAIAVAGLTALPVAWTQLEDYQRDRVEAFLHPEEADLRGDLWQTHQSVITVGSGGMAGKGYLKGTQTPLRYLPEHHTDFIFSLLGEENGFVGATGVITLFLLLLLRGLMFARRCPDLSGALLAVGAVTILAFHIFVNIGITLGILPVTGLPLPFLSYGGSFYLTTMMCVGMMLNIPMRTRLFE